MWKETPEGLQKEFVFKDFQEAFAFMTRVAFLAEAANHHPDWKNSYNKVSISLCTHSENNSITQKDRELAGRIDLLLP